MVTLLEELFSQNDVRAMIEKRFKLSHYMRTFGKKKAFKKGSEDKLLK